MDENIRRGRGRPKKEESINGRLEIRIGPSEKAALEHMVIESDKTKSDIIRRALMTYYNMNYGKWWFSVRTIIQKVFFVRTIIQFSMQILLFFVRTIIQKAFFVRTINRDFWPFLFFVRTIIGHFFL